MNEQPTKELEYFQRVQVLTQQVKSLQFENGVLTSELHEARHKYTTSRHTINDLEKKIKTLNQELQFTKNTGLIVKAKGARLRIAQQQAHINHLTSQLSATQSPQE